MLGRRQTDNSAQLRSSLADAAFAVEERVVWGGADLLRGIFELVKWPFERAIWAIERSVVWPLEKRTGAWNTALQAGGVAALALLAAGAGVLGLVWASGSGGSAPATEASNVAPAPAPIVRQAPPESPAQTGPVLHGATPDFSPENKVGAAQALTAPAAGEAAETTASSAPAADGATASTSTSSTPTETTKVVAVGPAATEVAHRFAGAFVHFETGQVDSRVRTAFAATATPLLARRLLRRPPRLPANVTVPRAKVLNIVPGPKHGDTYTMSVSLLRVGVTSELRIDMERDPQAGEWKVTDVRG
jgi:hypothetical protein